MLHSCVPRVLQVVLAALMAMTYGCATGSGDAELGDAAVTVDPTDSGPPSDVPSFDVVSPFADTGSAIDAGSPVDTGGAVDAGSPVDTPATTDAGTTVVDAGSPATDAGTADAGVVTPADAGCSGIRLGAVALADETNPGAFDARLAVADCALTRLAQTYRDCSGIFGGFVRDSRVEHNNVSETNWAGLTLGWGGWGGAPLRPSLGGNKILGNAISRVNLVTGDGGPIYVMGQQQESAACGADDLSCRSEMAGNFVSYAMHHAAMLYHDEGTVGYYTHGNVVLQPLLTDPHGWWWSWAAAWASTEHNILIAENFAVGVNRSDMAAGNNLVIVNNTLLPWGSAWPPAAAAIIAQAGPRPQA